MSSIHPEENDIEGTPKMTGEECANRIFAISMAGLCAAILLMIIMGGY